MLAQDVVDDVLGWAAGTGIGTPAYLFSPGAVRAGVAQLRKHLTGRISYATKANAHPRMLAELEPRVDEFNVTNPVHLDAVLALGVDPARITFLNPVCGEQAVRAVADRGVTRFVVDDERGLRLAHAAVGSALSLTLRLRPPDAGESRRSVVRFGAGADALRDLAATAAGLGVRIEALSFFVGTAGHGMAEALPFRLGIEALGRLHGLLTRDGVAVPAVNIGGGFPGSRRRLHAEFPDFFPRIAEQIARHLPEDIDLVCEPGRFLAEPSMAMLTRVIADRTAAGRRMVHLDASSFGGLFEVTLLAPDPAAGPDFGYVRRAGSLVPAEVLGPIMDSFDVLARNAPLPPLGEGELIVLPNIGAYSWEYAARCEGLGVPAVHDLPEALDTGFATAWFG